MERLWPALEHIDTSSGALGGAVHRTLGDLIPILISAPADVATRSAWLERRQAKNALYYGKSAWKISGLDAARARLSVDNPRTP
jgi:hypothetical protein